MNNQATNEFVENNLVEIDLLDIIKLLWHNLWIILVSMILCGSILFTSVMFFVTPQYTASAMLYVNNSSISVGSSSISISASQISAARSLLDLYVIILESRTTLEQAIDRADLPYTYSQLRNIVSASSVAGTEIFTISATCANSDDAKLIVDTLVDILPDRISDILDGSSVRLVDSAVRPVSRSFPSYTRYGMIGAILGAVISCAVIIIRDLMNNTVSDEDYLRSRYSIPLLAVVPDASAPSGKPHGHFSQSGKMKNGSSWRAYEESYERAQKKNGTNGGNK